jgi:hypothetical protein
MGVAAADFDNDGWVDLFVTGVHTNHLFHNRRDGTFEELLPQDGKWAVAAAWFDYDNDGLLDLFVVRYISGMRPKEIYWNEEYRQYCHAKEYRPLTNSLYRTWVAESSGTFPARAARRALRKRNGRRHRRLRRRGFRSSWRTIPCRISCFGTGRWDGGLPRRVPLTKRNGGQFHGRRVPRLTTTARGSVRHGLKQRDFFLFRNTGKGTFGDMTLLQELRGKACHGRGVVCLADFTTMAGRTCSRQWSCDGQRGLRRAGSQATQSTLTNGRKVLYRPDVAGAAFHRGLAWGDLIRRARGLVITRLNEPAQVLWNRTEAPVTGSPSTLKAQNRTGMGLEHGRGGDRRGEAKGPGGRMVGIWMFFEPSVDFGLGSPGRLRAFSAVAIGAVQVAQRTAGQIVKLRE